MKFEYAETVGFYRLEQWAPLLRLWVPCGSWAIDVRAFDGDFSLAARESCVVRLRVVDENGSVVREG